jgi:uroporphyrinogen III methyltransferase/synthase
MMTVGKIYLVGAGIGEAGLISELGKKKLHLADVIVTDRLIDPAVLLEIDSSKIIYVGKTGGKKSITQDEINRLLIDHAKSGKNVVRLKGGDPLIFGRGGEELEAVVSEGVPFEIIPGITAAAVAAAYCGIPLTHRDFASTMAFVTGHEDPEKFMSSIDYSALAKMGTIVLYMGVTTLRQTITSLIDAGLSSATPSVIIEQAGSPLQRTLLAPVSELADLAELEDIRPPALVIIGKVVELRNKLAWFEKKILFGKKIILTRPADRMKDLHDQLAELGACVIPVPVINLVDLPDYSAVDREIIAAVDGCYHWLALTSPKTVDVLFDRLAVLGKDVRALSKIKIAVIGQATADKVLQARIAPDLMPDKFTSLALTDSLLKQKIKGQKILLLRSELADDQMTETLTSAGAIPHQLGVYRTEYVNEIDPLTLERLHRCRKIDMIVFTSSSTVKGFYSLAKQYELDSLIENARRISIGPVTTKTLQQLNLPADAIADEQTSAGIIRTILSESALNE